MATPYDVPTPRVQSSAFTRSAPSERVGVAVVALWLASALLTVGCHDLDAERAGAQVNPPPAEEPAVATSQNEVAPPPAALLPQGVNTNGPGTCYLPLPVHHPSWVRARGVVFAHVDDQDLALDVFRAPGDEPKPALVLLHGGGWKAGARGHVNEPARAFASLGYAAVPVSYRLLSGERARFPAAVNDVRCAVRYLRVHAAELGIDPERIGVLGFSAGGHLAAMVATASDVSALEPECPSREGSPEVQAAVSFYGAHDLNARFGSGARRLISDFMGPPNSAEQRSAASPITYVDEHDPPMLLVHGVRDAVVPVEQSRLMHARLLAAHVPTELVEVREGLHGFSIFREGRHPRASCTTLRFLAAHLHPTAPPPMPRRPTARPAPVPAAASAAAPAPSPEPSSEVLSDAP